MERYPRGLYLKNRNFQVNGHKAIAFMARQSDTPCAFRGKCFRPALTGGHRFVY